MSSGRCQLCPSTRCTTVKRTWPGEELFAGQNGCYRRGLYKRGLYKRGLYKRGVYKR